MLDALWERRALLVSGKGGVGKTTVTAALARAAVASGRRVLLAEVEAASENQDAPSPLGSLVGARASGSQVTEVSPGLSFIRLSAVEGQRLFLQDVLPLRLMADAAMRTRALRRFLEAAPALREMGVLYQMLHLLRRTRPDGSPLHPLCILDLPATGHALAIAALPDALLSVIPGGPIGRSVREGLALLRDPRLTGALLVTLPEPLPVSETLELATAIQRHRIPIAAGVLNRMPDNPFSPDGRAAVARLLDEHGPHLGQRALGRLDRARAAEARLAGNLPAPLVTLPELPASGSELVERLAAHLTRPATVPPAAPSHGRAGARS
ncbi:ArsA-related P-loop ATPase [Vitiosangium sp. GDMCC 1.1324]|uniref:ArsA-related P-loop ATPase n=1 Tax=Vitiosangium sp. (strain GDMCC 1.1324) TaxID=2138576 RepID=UPI000D3B02AB|nr:ArsA-related P-loop ATPase [Vitiosangium sp. GDMCC 1.1324]PTL79599.1 arsenic transporter [Vitiosangium sp. GDMCC 1.1324]